MCLIYAPALPAYPPSHLRLKPSEAAAAGHRPTDRRASPFRAWLTGEYSLPGVSACRQSTMQTATSSHIVKERFASGRLSLIRSCAMAPSHPMRPYVPPSQHHQCDAHSFDARQRVHLVPPACNPKAVNAKRARSAPPKLDHRPNSNHATTRPWIPVRRRVMSIAGAAS